MGLLMGNDWKHDGQIMILEYVRWFYLKTRKTLF